LIIFDIKVLKDRLLILQMARLLISVLIKFGWMNIPLVKIWNILLWTKWQLGDLNFWQSSLTSVVSMLIDYDR